MPGDAAQFEGPRVVNLSLHPFAISPLGRRSPLFELVRRKECCVLHPQRLKDVLLREFMDVLSADLFHQFSQHHKTYVAIGESFSG